MDVVVQVRRVCVLRPKGGKLLYSKHRNRFQKKLLSDLGMDNTKLTHACRAVFAVWAERYGYVSGTSYPFAITTDTVLRRFVATL